MSGEKYAFKVKNALCTFGLFPFIAVFELVVMDSLHVQIRTRTKDLASRSRVKFGLEWDKGMSRIEDQNSSFTAKGLCSLSEYSKLESGLLNESTKYIYPTPSFTRVC